MSRLHVEPYASQSERLPPQAADVPRLMADFVVWIAAAQREALPAPVIAGLAHYQLVTIHPFFDGNGRTARTLATWILYRHGAARDLLSAWVADGWLEVADPARKSRRYHLSAE